ncbi:glycosyltransferase family 2 protein [Phytohabitans rumicis]|uniref:Glycosyl transferase family 2 n=1 Tax=Phytohabitans rumicis TaxID=1076125 RepID=A0A6V8KW50_9ACTN|nr:glycosyltransferase family 2 protein [Phytohabitans rumicis]GFJ89312.1 glycosyl transferase family 2 [Phytohabitans rumicis]
MISTLEMVAVIVVTYNSENLIADLMASLAPGLMGFRWRLIVADNASADGTIAALKEHAPDATVVEMGRNAGYAAGINAAMAVAGPHTAVLVLNPDVRLGPGCVERLMPVLRSPGTGIAVPRLRDGDGALIQTMRREPSVLRILGDAFLGAGRAGRYDALGEVVTDERRYRSEAVTDWAEGSTMLISAECWRRNGGWDESFFLYSEETDYALRARDNGLLTRYTPTADAVHLGGESRVSPGLWTLLTLNRVRLYSRRHGRLSTAAFWAALFLREASRALIGKRPSRMAARALLSPARLRETPGPHVVARAG